MSKSIVLCLMICLYISLASSNSFAQNEKNDKPDSILFKELSIDAALSWLNDNYVESSDTFHEKALHTLARVEQLKKEPLIAEAHLLLMRWHAFHVPFTSDSIHYHGDRAIALFKKIKEPEKLAITSVELAFEYIEANELERSEKLIFNAIEIYEQLEDEKGLALAYSTLSSIFLSQKEPNLSIKYGLEALKMTEKVEDYTTSSEVWLALVSAYHDAGKLQKAIEAADKCIATIYTYEIDDEFNLARAYGSRGDVWADLGEYEKSLEDNKKCYEIVEAKIGAARPAAKTYRQGVGRAYFLQAEYQKALPHLEATVEGYIELGQGSQPKMQKIYQLTAACHLQLGNYQKAFEYQQLAQEIYETLMQNKVANLETEALFKYESGKKDQAINEQATIIAQNDRVQWLAFGLISILALFLSTLYYYFNRNKKTTKALNAKNQENELLLKEIHHRVKNNLEMVKSLIALQSAQIEDPATRDAMIASQNRVQSMGIIHQKLYQGTNLGSIEMKDYFMNLGEGILDTFDAEEQVKIEYLMDNLDLDVDTAVPIGLIVNELLTNALKYAFPENEKGTIEISLEKTDDNYLKLRVNDNGIGKTVGLAPIGTGFGSQLVELLTQQLNGKMKEHTGKGTHIEFNFLLKKSA